MIVLTGVSGGIGNNIIQSLSSIDNVLGIYNNNKPPINLNKNKVILFKIDLTDEKKIKKFIDENLKKEKKITLIHLASIKNDNLILNQDIKKLKNIFELNFFAPYILSKYIIEIMVKNNWGRIIYFSSTGGEKGDQGTSAYTSSKLALLGLSRVISKEYARFNITSNVIKLGNFNTGLFKKLPKSKQKTLIENIPSKKLGDFKDISSTIRLIINSNYINGAEINIDGGM